MCYIIQVLECTKSWKFRYAAKYRNQGPLRHCAPVSPPSIVLYGYLVQYTQVLCTSITRYPLIYIVLSDSIER